MTHQVDVLLRTIAALIGGYLVSVAFSFACVPILVLSHTCEKHEAVMVGTMLSYLVYFAVIIVSFCRKSSVLLWRDLGMFLGLCGAIIYMLGEV
jgi:predicted cobalt transporter CbtA